MEEQVLIHSFTGNTFDTSPSFLLKIKGNDYIFNLPEMTSKMQVATNFEYKNIRTAFITSLFPDSVGGLSLFIVQDYNQGEKLFQIVGPSQIKDVILFDPDYVDERITNKHTISVLNNFSNDDIEVNPINLSQSISYDVYLKVNDQHMLVVDCRSLDDIHQLPSLQQFSVIVHLTKPEVLVQKEYHTFFASHINISFMPSGIISNYESLNYYKKRQRRVLNPLSTGKTLKPPPDFVDFTGTDSIFDFETKRITCMSPPKYVDIDFYELKDLDSFDIFSKVTVYEPKLPNFDKYAITVLGTSTRNVTQERNNSGYLIHTHYGYIAVDPSEGYVSQLTRKYGPKQTKYILKNIECVWLSHFHEDHCFGIPSLLYERSKLTDKKIIFYGPQKFLDDINKISSYYGDFKVIYHNREVEGRVQESEEDMSLVPNDLPINDHIFLKSIDVYHSIKYAKGCMFLIDGETTIAFSGDRGFQKDHFTEVFGNCDLLIHEATFDYKALRNPKVRQITKHCSINDAKKIVKMMNAKYALFVHLSNRNDYYSFLNKPAKNILVAFDFLEFSSNNIDIIWDKCGISKYKKK